MTTGEASASMFNRTHLLRKAWKLSTRQLADQVTEAGYPVSRAILANQENGRVSHGTVDQLAAVSRVFSVPYNDLLTGSPCEQCLGFPPAGFTCNACGTGEAA